MDSRFVFFSFLGLALLVDLALLADLALLPRFFVAIGFLQSVVDQQNHSSQGHQATAASSNTIRVREFAAAPLVAIARAR